MAVIDGKAEVREGESRSFGCSSPAALKKAGKSSNTVKTRLSVRRGSVPIDEKNAAFL